MYMDPEGQLAVPGHFEHPAAQALHKAASA